MNDNKNEAACQIVMFSVYVLWCSKTDMHYVGVTSKKITARIRQHRRGKRQFLDREIQKIGWENFDWWVVEEGIPSELISECEKKWVKRFDCVHPKGYNRTTGGIKFFKHTEECKAKMSAKSTGENNPFYGKHHTPETKAQMSIDRTGEKGNMYGKHHTEESKANMRQAHLGKPLSEEHKAKMRGRKLTEEHKAKLRGRKHTEEEKAKIRKARTGEKRTEETKAKIRKKLTGRKLTEEHKANIRKANTGKKNTEKTRAILREKALARWAAKRAAKAAEEAAKNSST